MLDFLKKFLASSNEGELKKIRKIVDQINALEPSMYGKTLADYMAGEID